MVRAPPAHPTPSWQAPGGQLEAEQLLHCFVPWAWVGSAEGARKWEAADLLPDVDGH